MITTPAALLALWRARIEADRAAGRNIQAQVVSECADALELALAQVSVTPTESETE